MDVFKPERLAEIEANSAAAPVHTVLVVDDEDGNRIVLRALLKERFRVMEASDGQSALELLQALAPEERPCVILSDQRMPRMTGVDFFDRARALCPDTIRIIITGFVDVGAIVDAINRAGIYKFVVKPFDRDDLLLTVERAIEAFTLRRQLDDYVQQLEDKVRERTIELEEKNLALSRAYQEIEKASLTDPLTGLGNRRLFSQLVSSENAALDASDRRSARGARTAFLIVDIDHFKSVNDNYGHAAGDAVLSAMGEILRAHCRDGDVAVRWGGEEFLLRVGVDDEEHALVCAERLRARVAATQFALGDGSFLRCTCSIGVACQPFDPAAPDALDWQRTLSVADAALYLAKREGRNAAVCLAAAAELPHDFGARIDHDLQGLMDASILRCLRSP